MGFIFFLFTSSIHSCSPFTTGAIALAASRSFHMLYSVVRLAYCTPCVCLRKKTAGQTASCRSSPCALLSCRGRTVV